MVERLDYSSSDSIIEDNGHFEMTVIIPSPSFFWVVTLFEEIFHFFFVLLQELKYYNANSIFFSFRKSNQRRLDELCIVLW